MGLTQSLPVVLAALAACAANAQPSAELLDLAARVHYGYYHREARTIEAAEAALGRLADSPEVLYYRDFAALRRAQLGSLDRNGAARLAQCARREAAASVSKVVAADAWALVAACALFAGDERRSAQALARARERDVDNPRIALVDAWTLERAAADDPALADAVTAKFVAAVEAFQRWTPSIDDPDWGHAEALTALAADALRRGQIRAARDLVERALLVVPEYGAAVELRTALQGGRGSERAL
jgi:hypothetical protein